MRLVYSFNCSEHMEELLTLCRISKDLYNQALYVCIQAMKQDEPKFFNYYDLNDILQNTYNLEGTINYRLLKAQVSQQTLKLVATAMKSYFKAIKDYKQHPDKYTGQPKMLNYLPRNGYYNRMDDLMHKVSRHIVNTLERNKVGTLVCGRNKGWKDSIDLGRRTNQQFVQIPHERLISMLRYKCETVGIRFIENEESYTSKCDAFALEPVCKHESYLGKRVHRGLFQSSTGRTLNADVNGALNILRKVVGDSSVSKIVDSGWLFQPRKLNNLHCLSS